MGVSFNVVRNFRSGITGVGDLRLPLPEHSHTVYCVYIHFGHVSINRAEAGVKGGQELMGAGRLGLGGGV